MDVITRRATLNDLPVLDGFLQQLVNAERPFDETIKEGIVIYYDLKALIESDDAELLVLEKDGALVGCGYAHIRKAKSYLTYEEYAHLGFMYVMPEYRGMGLNQQLIAALKQWVLSKGVREVRLEVYEENIGAVKAYEKAGFKKLLSTMRCEIG
ncbi:GNAT family N-acetyltransferase [Chitinophaga ginsengisoli]|uniref:Acetyltransferase (GNAT) family protein n=1 Tax=Chitinophaga ginsengisoli TaxID=363837 RepID=A0A2P8G2Y2_9BACT|nr:GNAT family N-acetyltransferase [Chitinophaga ginsengisoli]PSL28235.1 acetyltransferase (GNAT) family protein [Chitinophaga ginsengisoli]